ncbi:hypothetical protein [Mycobacterium sp.]|uniref:hypothetical protein n=1 Tax=Mycobacterium sp. TaxID=1785 RepID=UPI002CED14EF|nr:hypothetical protein [Mycobacterium sp.]HKP39623.1 hypothetical protein [Mycobacterium sp.]
MPLNLKELREWPPEIADLAGATRSAATNHTNSADFYRSLAKASIWEGDGGDAARAAMVASAGEHDAVADNLGTAATGMDHAQQLAEAVAQEIKDILDYAASAPAVQINESTNQVLPPDTTYLDEEAAAKVAAKVADLQARIAAALTQGEGVDADLAGAIATATGTPAPVLKTASSVGDLLAPNTEERKAPPSADGRQQPDNLDTALGQLAGKPGQQPAPPKPAAGDARAPLPLDPKAVETFKSTARQMMLRDGVPPDQIEQRLDAMVAAAQKPLPAYTPPKPDKMPPPGFGDGFADRWFATEQGIKNLFGQGGPGAPGVLESWGDLIKGTNNQITNPVGTAIDEVKAAANSPSAAYYLGGKAADGMAAAPGIVFGPEAAFGRAAALDDLASVGAVPHELIEHPTPTGAFEHHTPAIPFTGDHTPPPVWDYSDGYAEHAPAVASNLNDAFVNGQPTVDLARQVADLSTHHMPGPPDTGIADRVVLGKWAGMDDGYIGEARANGGIYFDTGSDTWDAIGHGLSRPDTDALGWQVNEQFLRTQMESQVGRIDYILDHEKYASLEDMAIDRAGSFSAMEVAFLSENAASYGYQRVGESWVYVGGGRR